jgi:TolB-like protein
MMDKIVCDTHPTRIARERRFDPARAIAIALDIGAGLAAAHAAGVVHRDLKPENVLLASDGRTVVTDFGIARAAAGGDASRTMGAMIGTPAYMAPEQVEGVRDVDERADIYAFGEVLYEMLTGQRAWPGTSLLAVASARLLTPPPDPRALRPELDVRVAALIARCMARRRDDRYGTMWSVLSELEDLAATLASHAQKSGSRSVVTTTPSAMAPIRISQKRVAVLPFRNLGPASEDYVADGLTDDLIDLLSVAPGLRVNARGVVMQYKGSERDPREVGRELGVQVVVEGSVRRTPGAFRMSARVVSVADGIQIWAQRFDGPEADVLVMNDSVARAVATALTVDLQPAHREAASDPVAVDLYLRARMSYYRFVERGAAETRELFARARERAPDDPRVIAGYVMAHARTFESPERALQLRADAERAIALSPSLPDAHVGLASVHVSSNEAAQAVLPLRRALRLSPHHAEAHEMLGRVLVEIDASEGVRHVEAALALEPAMALPRSSLVRFYMLRREDLRAEATADDSPDRGSMLPMRIRLALWRRDREAMVELALQLGMVAPTLHGSLRQLMNALLDPGSLAPTLVGMFGPAPRSMAFSAQLDAECAGTVGLPGRALDDLERMDALGLYDLAWIDRCPALDALRADPRFVAVRAHVAERAARARAAFDAKLR